jgi:hypothetical protein
MTIGIATASAVNVESVPLELFASSVVESTVTLPVAVEPIDIEIASVTTDTDTALVVVEVMISDAELNANDAGKVGVCVETIFPSTVVLEVGTGVGFGVTIEFCDMGRGVDRGVGAGVSGGGLVGGVGTGAPLHARNGQMHFSEPAAHARQFWSPST